MTKVNTFRALNVLGLITILSATNALASDPSKCTPSKWGPDDEIGAANLVTPERTLQAVKLVKKGVTHPLGIVVDPGMPAFPPRSMSLQVVSPGQHNGRSLEGDFGWNITYNDDLAQLWFGMGPQLDGLGHLAEGGMYYNCNDARDFVHVSGLKKLGTHNVPPIVARGVVVDMAKHKGVDALAGGQPISSADIRAAAAAQGVEFREGDVILIHTGWTDAKLESAPDEWNATMPGLTNEAAAWLGNQNPIAVGADTSGVEAVPPAPGDRVFYGHVELLAKRGVYILETMNTGRLAREGVREFLFVLGQPRIKGTVQMIINPVAMW
jgi:kynurenine formamidase